MFYPLNYRGATHTNYITRRAWYHTYMDPQERKLLDEAVSLARENNKLLKKIHRAAVWGRVIRTIYWVVIIGVTVGALYFLQPYVDQLQSIYGQVQDTQAQLSDLF